MTDIKQYGAVLDGLSDDTSAWMGAIIAAQNGDRVVTMPPGTSLVRDHNQDGFALLVKDIPIKIVGSGRGASKIRLANGRNCHLFQFENLQGGGSISDLTLDGNRSHQTSGHVLRGKGWDRMRVERVEIVNAWGHAMTLYEGAFKDVLVRDCVVRECGGAGLDIRNLDGGNRNLLVRGMRVRKFGMNPTAPEAAVNLRGPGIIRDTFVSDLGTTSSGLLGIRVWATDGAEIGGHQSVVDGFQIYATVKNGTKGLELNGFQCVARDGFVQGCSVGVQSNQIGNVIRNIQAQNCADAFDIQGDDSIISACHATSCTRAFYTNKQNTQFIGSGAKLCGYSFFMDASAVYTRIIGGYSLSPTSGHIGGTGTNTVETNLLKR